MLRVLHTADVHLGARHTDLGERANAQRDRQFAAFRASIDLAIKEKVDLFLVAGDLFDSNTQPRRSVERAAAELRRLADARIRAVVIPGTHDVYDASSVYRAYDLAALAGLPSDSEQLVVLTPDRPSVHLAAIDTTVYGRVFATKRAPQSPLAGFSIPPDDPATWRIGMIHGSFSIPGKTDGDEVVFTEAEVAASGLDYLALGHWHSTLEGMAGRVPWAYSGAPEPVALDQDRAGNVLLVVLNEVKGERSATIEPRAVGRTRFERVEVDAATAGSQPALIASLAARADPDLVLDVVLTGLRPDDLDLDIVEAEAELAPSFFRVRVRDRSVPPLTEGALPPPDTIAGAFIRDAEARIAELEAAGAAADAAELRDALRLGRLLLGGREVTL